jgi:hypothetical protein
MFSGSTTSESHNLPNVKIARSSPFLDSGKHCRSRQRGRFIRRSVPKGCCTRASISSELSGYRRTFRNTPANKRRDSQWSTMGRYVSPLRAPELKNTPPVRVSVDRVGTLAYPHSRMCANSSNVQPIIESRRQAETSLERILPVSLPSP